MERVVCLLIGYAFGLFQTSYFIGKAHHTDIRTLGSGNAGTTNALRSFGKKAGALTLLGDLLKCVAAILVVNALYKNSCAHMLPLLGMYGAFGCVLGHNFPFYLGFRGGKGIAASAGMVLALDFRVFVICAVLFFALFFAFHYVSLCSICTYVAAFVCFAAFGAMGRYGMERAYVAEMDGLMGLMTLLALYRHRANISRLLKGEESKVYLGKKKQ